MAQRFKKRRLVKWGSPAVGGILIILVVTWPSAVCESVQHSSLINCIFGMTYRGKQPNGEAFLLKAPSAHEIDASHIVFEKPSIETNSIKMEAISAKLNIPKQHIICDGPVELRHEFVHIKTKRADLHLGAPAVADAASAQPSQ